MIRRKGLFVDGTWYAATTFIVCGRVEVYLFDWLEVYGRRPTKNAPQKGGVKQVKEENSRWRDE